MATELKSHPLEIGRSCVIRLALCVAVISGCSSDESRRRNATVAYWAALSRLGSETAAACKAIRKPASKLEAAGVLAQMQTLAEKYANSVMHLNSRYVDEDVVGLAADHVQISRESQTTFQEMERLMRQEAARSSPDQMSADLFEAFFRGALGDPYGKHNELMAVAQKMENQGDRLRVRLAHQQQKLAELDGREVKLRVTLANRYGCEFPSLSPARRTAQ